MGIDITANYDENKIAQALAARAQVDFNDLVENGKAVNVTVHQTGEGAVVFEVTLATYAVGITTARKILSDALN